MYKYKANFTANIHFDTNLFDIAKMIRIVILLCAINSVHTLPLTEFFSFGTEANDQIFPPNDDGSVGPLALPRIFPYFNNNHRQIYLANNGLFSFLGPVYQYVATPFPLGDNRRLIAGFWTDIDTRGNIPSGNRVYYQIYSNHENTNVFEKATTYVQSYFPGERSFTPTMVITGTWYRVGAFPSQTHLTNTFQIVLATDEIRSFAFLLYHDLQWASPQGGASNDPNIPDGNAAQAGFNAGDGIVFEMLPYSRTTGVRRLMNISNVNVPGLFVFRIDTDSITLGGCGNESQLIFRPRRGSQLGRTPITIQGPCFTNLTGEDVKCRFGESDMVDAIIIDRFQAICLTPFVSLPQFTSVYLSTDGGMTFDLFPQLFTYTPVEFGLSSIDNPQVLVLNQTDMILNTGELIDLQWYLSENTINSWSNATIVLDIEMCIVTLNQSNGGVILNTCTALQTNVLPIMGLQNTTLTLPSHGDQANLPTIFFNILARNSETNQTYAGLNSALFVLHDNGTETGNVCQSWIITQPSPPTWNDGLLPCPLTLAQARVARCCYTSDPLCNENNYNLSSNCALHQGRSNREELSAVACYLSRFTNQLGASAECCYDSIGQLINRGLGAGTDDRYHPSTYPSEHYFNDELPYFACCLLSSNEEMCEQYFNRRPPRRGSNTRNTGGGTWGDPHYTTLDGSSYTFNGYGEYTYLAITDVATPLNTAFNPSIQTIIFDSQIRTTTMPSLGTQATVIRGFAASSNTTGAQKISVTISQRELIIIRRGNETLDLDTTNDDTILTNNALTLFFPEMTLEKNRTTGVLTLSWSIGVSVQISPVSVAGGLVFNLGISVSGQYQNRTFGLLGVYDNDQNNDLRAQNGTIVGLSNTLSPEQIHREFGQTWTINPVRSLFYYENGDSAWIYANQNNLYVPSFVPPNPPLSRMNATFATCGIDPTSTNRSIWTLSQQTCYYDMAVTNNSAMGQASSLAAENVLQAIDDQRYPPEFNSNLPSTMTVNVSTPITIDFTAVSQYTSSITYNLLQGPPTASFNSTTARFNWERPDLSDNNTVVRVSARDAVYNLLSTHEILIYVNSLNEISETSQSPVVQTSQSSVVQTSQSSIANISRTTQSTIGQTNQTISPPVISHGYTLPFSWIFVLINILGTFYFL